MNANPSNGPTGDSRNKFVAHRSSFTILSFMEAPAGGGMNSPSASNPLPEALAAPTEET